MLTTSCSFLAVNGPAQGREFVLAGGQTQLCYRDGSGAWWVYRVVPGDGGLELRCICRLER